MFSPLSLQLIVEECLPLRLALTVDVWRGGIRPEELRRARIGARRVGGIL